MRQVQRSLVTSIPALEVDWSDFNIPNPIKVPESIPPACARQIVFAYCIAEGQHLMTSHDMRVTVITARHRLACAVVPLKHGALIHRLAAREYIEDAEADIGPEDNLSQKARYDIIEKAVEFQVMSTLNSFVVERQQGDRRKAVTLPVAFTLSDMDAVERAKKLHVKNLGKVSGRDTLLALVQMQRYDGSYPLDAEFAKVLRVEWKPLEKYFRDEAGPRITACGQQLEEVEQGAKAVWATLLAFAFFQVYLWFRRDEFDMLAEKARRLVHLHIPADNDRNDLIHGAKNYLLRHSEFHLPA